MQNIENEKCLQEDEIDLIELFKTILNYKKFILIFTGLVTVLAVIYVFVKTPIYEATAVVEIGTYKNDKFKNTALDNANNLSQKLNTVFISLKKNNKEFEITQITPMIGNPNYIEIHSEAKTNDEAKKGLDRVLEYIKVEHGKELDDIKEQNDVKLKGIDSAIQNKEDKIVNTDKKIDFLNQNILSLEEQLRDVMHTLEKENKFNPSISSLKLNISNAIISNKINLYSLIETKENLENVEINKLLDDKKKIETLNLPNNLKNSEVVGDILVNDSPIKPKKALIIVVAFVTGFILSIFLAFFIEFTKSFKKEETR